jgi:uncharacterized coiled-coil DUF342 family protein
MSDRMQQLIDENNKLLEEVRQLRCELKDIRDQNRLLRILLDAANTSRGEL